MKIEGPGPVRSTPVKRGGKSKKAAATGDFAQKVEATTDSVDPVSGLSPVQAVDALLAIQEVEDSTTGGANAQAKRWGEMLLDRLEGVRLGLLAGGIPVSELEGISAVVEREQAKATDPNLKELLAEIKLRARVELAKYRRSA
ncbi:MAG: flagellar assembly protein FliX [Alphaproteobacteria bacterium]|mgnify:CR=1 FL=1|jgi:hypothetical protein|nr:flagellar assembly protein FliX [Alphaproteobacteria bacterium]